MRRSAAPSKFSGMKKARFIAPYSNAWSISSKENIADHSKLDIPKQMLDASEAKSDLNILRKNNIKDERLTAPARNDQFTRSTSDVLKLLAYPPVEQNSSQVYSISSSLDLEEECMAMNCEENEMNGNSDHSKNLCVSNCKSNIFSSGTVDPKANLTSISDAKASGSAENSSDLIYSVLWCKHSKKKHKKWEGDAVLLIRNRTAVLKDLDGKVIAKGIGYKTKEVSDLEEGSTFFIGGKECEIQCQISCEDYLSGRCFQHPSSDIVKDVTPSLKRCKSLCIMKNQNLMGNSAKILPSVHMLDSSSIVMPRPSSMHQWRYNKQQLPVMDVILDRALAKHIRCHQKEGIVFLYECVLGLRDFGGQGAILADEMGLGKTLQCIALIWTLCRQGPYGGKPILKKVLIITPSSLVKNWESEFNKWLGKDKISILSIGPKNKYQANDFFKSRHIVLIISYEMFIRSADVLSSGYFDLVICDEGHRLKNLNLKISNVLKSLPTRRRILLTGTPIQNDLEEFYSIVEFVNPGILGSVSAFRKIYEEPIIRSRYSKSTEEDKETGKARASELSRLTGLFVLRRTQEVINQYLPPKVEAVVFCRPSHFQTQLYLHLLQSRMFMSCLASEKMTDGHCHLMCISALRKLCNHPCLLYHQMQNTKDNEIDQEINQIYEHMQPAFPENYVQESNDSGKIKVLERLLDSLYSSVKKEKIVVVSSFTQTLDVIEKLCRSKCYSLLRLDGSTSSSSRQNLVDTFNSPFSKEFIFLLSSKAGGVGFNLIGASRILLYDIDWNPANDLQAMSRVWRDGQKRVVFIYRLLTAGTIEEKMYQRQVTKQSISGTVMDANFKSKPQFSLDELKDLFTFHEDSQCLTHDLLKCKCLHHKEQEEKETDEYSCLKPQRPCQLGIKKPLSLVKNISMAELLQWTHIPGPISSKNISDSCLAAGGEDITFVFMNKINCNSMKIETLK